MSLLLAILITLTVYVVSFKDDFQPEAINKVASALIVILIICVAYMILVSLTS